jgi:hypothetical protein
MMCSEVSPFPLRGSRHALRRCRKYMVVQVQGSMMHSGSACGTVCAWELALTCVW